MKESEFIWQDGGLVAWEDAKTHILSHGLHYGSSVFEGIRFYEADKGAAVFRLDEHLDRLFFSAETLYMEVPFSKEEIKKAIKETIKANGLTSGYIRPIVYYGYGKMGLGVAKAPVNVAISVWPWGAYLGDKAVNVKTSSFSRICSKVSVMEAKISGHYVNSILAGEEARRAGYDEALLLHCDGRVAEGPGENLFIVKDKELITPKIGMILPGITRKSIIRIVEDMGMNVSEKDLSLEDVYAADEAFFAGTAAEVSPISKIDDIMYNKAPGQITDELKKSYLDIVGGKKEEYINWLSFVD